MRRAERLYELQKIDLTLDASRKRARTVEALLTESDTLRAARQAAEHARDRIAQLRTRLKDFELQSATLDSRIASLDERLYSGIVKNPKELSDLQRDIASLRRHKLELDETLLDIMAEIEDVEREQADVEAELTRVETAWQNDQAALVIEQAHLNEQIEALEAERGAQRANVPPPDLAQYDRVRAQKHGHAVAPLNDGACSACGVQPSASKLAQLRREDELLTCGNCERILVEQS